MKTEFKFEKEITFKLADPLQYPLSFYQELVERIQLPERWYLSVTYGQWPLTYQLVVTYYIHNDVVEDRYSPPSPLTATYTFDGKMEGKQFLNMAMWMYLNANLHEAREQLALDGKRILNPHTEEGQENFQEIAEFMKFGIV